MAKERIAFIGAGVMGSSMASRLLEAGYSLFVYNRTPAKAEPLLARGAVGRGSPKAAASEADIAITMLGYPDDVESVYLDPDGLIAMRLALPSRGYEDPHARDAATDEIVRRVRLRRDRDPPRSRPSGSSPRRRECSSSSVR